MSERSFALGCVGLALAVGIVVPDPGKPSAKVATPAIVLTEPAPQPESPQASQQAPQHAPRQAPQQSPEDALASMERVSLAAHHPAAPAKREARPAMFWAVRSSP